MSMVVMVLGGGRAIDSRVGRRRVPNCVETSFIPQGLPGCNWRGYSSSTMLLLCKHLKEVNVLRLQRCGRRLLPLEGWRRGGEELTVLMVAVGAAGNAVMVWIVVHDVVSERVGYRLAPWCMGGHDGGEGGGDVCEGKDAVGIVDHLPPPSCCPPLEKEREECINRLEILHEHFLRCLERGIGVRGVPSSGPWAKPAVLLPLELTRAGDGGLGLLGLRRLGR